MVDVSRRQIAYPSFSRDSECGRERPSIEYVLPSLDAHLPAGIGALKSWQNLKAFMSPCILELATHDNQAIAEYDSTPDR